MWTDRFYLYRELISHRECVSSSQSQIQVQMSMEISPQHHSIVLGKQSSNLKMIMQRTVTQIMFPDAGDPNIPSLKKSNVTITGGIHNVYLARQQLVVRQICLHSSLCNYNAKFFFASSFVLWYTYWNYSFSFFIQKTNFNKNQYFLQLYRMCCLYVFRDRYRWYLCSTCRKTLWPLPWIPKKFLN